MGRPRSWLLRPVALAILETSSCGQRDGAGDGEILSWQVLNWERERCSGLGAYKCWNGWGTALEEVSGGCDGGRCWDVLGSCNSKSLWAWGGWRLWDRKGYSLLRTFKYLNNLLSLGSSCICLILFPVLSASILSYLQNTALPLMSTIAVAYSPVKGWIPLNTSPLT